MGNQRCPSWARRFFNRFPTQIVALSEAIDRMLDDDAGPMAWRERAPKVVPQPVDRRLWNALHRRDAKLALAAEAERRERLQRFVERYLPGLPWLRNLGDRETV